VDCRSLLEPIRTSNPFATYVEAACDNLDVEKKVGTKHGHSLFIAWGALHGHFHSMGAMAVQPTQAATSTLLYTVLANIPVNVGIIPPARRHLCQAALPPCAWVSGTTCVRGRDKSTAGVCLVITIEPNSCRSGAQVALCTSAVAFEDGRRPQFEIPYDMVVVAVGEQPATFGVPGGHVGWFVSSRGLLASCC
jgi:hypothetical protein